MGNWFAANRLVPGMTLYNTTPTQAPFSFPHNNSNVKLSRVGSTVRVFNFYINCEASAAYFRSRTTKCNQPHAGSLGVSIGYVPPSFATRSNAQHTRVYKDSAARLQSLHSLFAGGGQGPSANDRPHLMYVSVHPCIPPTAGGKEEDDERCYHSFKPKRPAKGLLGCC